MEGVSELNFAHTHLIDNWRIQERLQGKEHDFVFR